MTNKPDIPLKTLGKLVVAKRGNRGLRDTAAEIGVSHGTLSRIENGLLPDLETFRKVCLWLNVDPGLVLGCKSEPTGTTSKPRAHVHFRKDSEITPEAAQALAQLILAGERALRILDENGEI